MNIKTVRSPRGKLVHAIRGEITPLTSATAMTEIYCGKEMQGMVDYDAAVDSITCPKCEKAFRAECADALTGMGYDESLGYNEPALSPVDAATHRAIKTMESANPGPRIGVVNSAGLGDDWTASAHLTTAPSPAVSAERRNGYSEGRARHGRIRQERAERRRLMKSRV